MGFPDEVPIALQQLPHIERMDISKLLPTARLLVSKRIKKTVAVAASAQSSALRNKAKKESSSLQCFRCRGPYYIKDCTEIPRAKVICYNCGKFGHIARYPLFIFIENRVELGWVGLHTTANNLSNTIKSILIQKE